jgi:hypothetical protein
MCGRTVGGGEIGRYNVRTAANAAYLGDNRVGFLGAAAVVHENLSTGRGKRDCACASHAPRGASDESGFAG